MLSFFVLVGGGEVILRNKLSHAQWWLQRLAWVCLMDLVSLGVSTLRHSGQLAPNGQHKARKMSGWFWGYPAQAIETIFWAMSIGSKLALRYTRAPVLRFGYSTSQPTICCRIIARLSK